MNSFNIHTVALGTSLTMWRGTSPKKLSYFDNRKNIQKLSKISDEVEIKKILNKLFNQLGITFSIREYAVGLKLWRIVDVPSRGRVEADFGYPPLPEHCVQGRCNKEGQQVFYASSSLGTCLGEMKALNRGKQFRAGLWEARKKVLCLDFSKQDDPKSKSEKIYNAIAVLFDNIGDDDYVRTSVIVDWVLNELSEQINVPGFPLQIDAVRYPSALRSRDDQKFNNFVFSKEAITTSDLILTEWHHMEVVEEGANSGVVRDVAKGSRKEEGVSENNELIWTEIPPEVWVKIPAGTTRVTYTKNGLVWEADQPLERFSPYNKIEW